MSAAGSRGPSAPPAGKAAGARDERAWIGRGRARALSPVGGRRSDGAVWPSADALTDEPGEG